MTTHHGRCNPSADLPPAGGENASVVATALALTFVLMIVMGAASLRVIAGVDGARALHDRTLAMATAEAAVVDAIAGLDAGGAAVAIARGTSVSEVQFLADQDGILEGGTESSVRLQIEAEEPRERIEVQSDVVVGGAHHSVTAIVRPRSTVDHLLLTGYEVLDPALLWHPRGECASVRVEPQRAPHCRPVVLGPGHLDGPVHSNDAIEVASGTTFGSVVTTSHLANSLEGRIGPAFWGSGLEPAANAPAFGLRYRQDVSLPRDVRDVIGGSAVTCRFRGPTLLRFDGQRVRVTSPRSMPRAGESQDPREAIGCFGVDRVALGGVVVVDLPDRTVIEVVRDPILDCVDHPLGLAHGEDTERDWWCTGGDAFVWGRYRGTHTVLAQDHVQLVWDVEPGDAAEAANDLGDDLLGLVAGDSIVLRRPVGRPIRRTAPYGLNLAFAGPNIAPFGAHPLDAPNAVPTAWDAPRIVASLVALRGSVTIQNPFRGQTHPGPVLVHGSLATRFRGVFAWEDRNDSGTLLGDMGYPLQLTYDRRLVRTTPPVMPLTDHGAVRILSLDIG
jgi:hypothetical protein